MSLKLHAIRFNRKQHKEEMDDHISKCIRNGDSKRRLRVIFDLKASASGENPNPTPVQSIQEVTLVLSGHAQLEHVLMRLAEGVLQVYSGLHVEVFETNFRPVASRVKSRIVIFLKGPSDHMNGAMIKIQVAICMVSFFVSFMHLCLRS